MNPRPPRCERGALPLSYIPTNGHPTAFLPRCQEHLPTKIIQERTAAMRHHYCGGCINSRTPWHGTRRRVKRSHRHGVRPIDRCNHCHPLRSAWTRDMVWRLIRYQTAVARETGRPGKWSLRAAPEHRVSVQRTNHSILSLDDYVDFANPVVRLSALPCGDMVTKRGAGQRYDENSSEPNKIDGPDGPGQLTTDEGKAQAGRHVLGTNAWAYLRAAVVVFVTPYPIWVK